MEGTKRFTSHPRSMKTGDKWHRRRVVVDIEEIGAVGLKLA
jgi:hypothetical protein